MERALAWSNRSRKEIGIPFFAVFLPVLTTLNVSSSDIPLTFGNGTENFAAFSFRLFFTEPRSVNVVYIGSFRRTRATQSLRICRIWSVQKILRERSVGRFCGGWGFHISFFVSLDLLLHLNLFMVSLLLIQLRSKTGQLLCIFWSFVSLSGSPLSRPLLVVQPSPVELCPSFHAIFGLDQCAWEAGVELTIHFEAWLKLLSSNMFSWIEHGHENNLVLYQFFLSALSLRCRKVLCLHLFRPKVWILSEWIVCEPYGVLSEIANLTVPARRKSLSHDISVDTTSAYSA